MRPINSNVLTPTYKLAKWLAKEMEQLKKPKDFSVINASELIEELKHETIEEDEVLVSFDIESYFPSVPVPESMDIIESWLDSQVSLNHLVREAYTDLINVCMNQSYFKFRGKFYHQSTGTAMGNPLSPFVCNMYVGALEKKISNHPKFPRFWRRFVDDILAIVKREKVTEVLDWLNTVDPNIKFTCAEEENGCIPFLDVNVCRNGRQLEFKVYRKPTSTDRFIINSSFHTPNQKLAAFHSMIFRLCNLPLNEQNFKNELEHIKKVATINGFCAETVDRIVGKMEFKKRMERTTTLKRIKTNEMTRKSFNYNPALTNKIKNKFKRHNIEMVFRSNCKLKNLLGSTKDKRVKTEKSGIYRATCEVCGITYVGKCIRAIKQRITEHLRYIKNKDVEETAFTEHVVKERHFATRTNFDLIEEVNDPTKLDLLESYHIFKNRHQVVNKDNGNAYSPLFEILKVKRDENVILPVYNTFG